jgi:hypothetical protein
MPESACIVACANGVALRRGEPESYAAAATAVGGRASLVEVFGDDFTLIDPSDRDWAIVLGALPGLLA